MTTQTYSLEGLHCKACVKRVSDALAPHAQTVQVSLDPMQAVITGASASLEQLQAAVAQAGNYRLQPFLTAELEETQLSAPSESASTASELIANPKNIRLEFTSPPSEAHSSFFVTYFPLLLIVSFILGASLLVQIGQHAGHSMGLDAISGAETMRYFMAGFFLVFAFFKLLDVRAFADAYAGYDLLARRWPTWGLIYPFVELTLGIAYLTHWHPTFTHVVTITVMGFSALGVIQAVMSKSAIRCACLGTVFKLPMSTVTIVEDVGMVLMATWMLLSL